MSPNTGYLSTFSLVVVERIPAMAKLWPSAISTIVDARRVSRRHRAVGLKSWPQLGQTFDAGVVANALVFVEDDRVTLPLWHLYGNNFRIEFAVVTCRDSPLMTAHGPEILFFPANPVAVCHDLARVAHVVVVESTPQAIVYGGIEHVGIAEPVSLARVIASRRISFDHMS